MKLSDNGIRLIKRFEGYHRKLPDGGCIAYRCPAGVWTIGYGTTAGVKPGLIWTEAQAEAALRDDVVRFESAVLRLVRVPLNQNQFDALVSFTYNVGEGALAKSSVLRCVNAGDMAGAARAFALWNKAGGKVLPGLVERRAREAALFARPVAEEVPVDAPIMPQQVDVPPDTPVGSRKWSLTQWLRGLFGGGAAAGATTKAASDAGFDPFGVITQLASFMQAYGIQIAIVACVLGYLAAEALKVWQQQDVEEGRSVSSREVQ